MHVFDIAGTDAVFRGAHGFKQHRLADRMEDHEQDGSPYGLFHADAGAGDDQSQIGDGGKGKHFLGVVLGDRHHAGSDEGEAADEGHHRTGQRAI